MSVTKNFTINVQDILESGQIDLSNSVVAENAAGAAVGTVTGGVGAVYNLIDNAGGRFVIDAASELYL